LTQDNLTPIFTEVSNNVNDIAMTIADKIREETFENTTFNYIKGLFQNGASIELISKSFGLSIQKVEEIIQKIKASSN
jgi:hypothetical protein